ncbi:exonuclease domain-containing protein [Demequina aurantiaca]|uniref:exonuclease domain-containing protein n=1 Tax=Demequina aurantiaca TaxID=676200 RepID=UPI003D34DAB6
MTWLEQTMVGFDTETTGVSTSNDRIVTAAVITRTGSGASASVDARTWLINPGVPIPVGATAVHGITDAMVQAEGQSPADALEEIASILAGALSAGFPVVAFNAQFDVSILEAELARHGLPSLASRLATDDIRPVVDPLVLDRHLDRWRRGKRKLVNMCETYGVPVVADDLHAADADVLATLDVIQAIAVRYPKLGEVALTDLHDQQVEAHRKWATEFSAWLTSKGTVDDLPSPSWPV